VDGRWYGRGTADCKGNIFVHLTALRALGDEVPVNLRLVVEGSEETTGALEGFVPGHADLLRADAILVGDAGNAAVGHPAVTVSLRGVADVIVHVKALASELHSGLFGGPAPDTLAALARRYPRHRPVDAAGNHPRKGDDDPRPLGTESESHLELKERCTGHSFWVYWAPFFLASGAPLLGIPV
jgi:acetylornithine deacetylase/succinyl-diaminopimelate desuccinylase-like protein